MKSWAGRIACGYGSDSKCTEDCDWKQRTRPCDRRRCRGESNITIANRIVSIYRLNIFGPGCSLMGGHLWISWRIWTLCDRRECAYRNCWAFKAKKLPDVLLKLERCLDIHISQLCGCCKARMHYCEKRLLTLPCLPVRPSVSMEQLCQYGATLSVWSNSVSTEQLCQYGATLSVWCNSVSMEQLCQYGATLLVRSNSVSMEQLC